MNSILMKAKEIAIKAMTIVKRVSVKIVAVVTAVGTGIVSMSSDAAAAISLDMGPILADVATVGAAAVGVTLAITAFAIAFSMIKKGRS